MFGGNFAPAGWAFCEGQLLPISENETLFNLIGTTYGGDGQETFALPDLRGRVPIHQGKGASGISYQLAETGGVETVTLTVNQIAQHTHPFLCSLNGGTLPDANTNVISSSPSTSIFVQDVASTPLNNASLTPVGGSQPHDNFQNYLCIDFIISLFGIFPSPS
jgi:microcystin-dependent protein